MRRLFKNTLLLSFTLLSWYSNAQINTYGNTINNVVGENVFFDMSGFSDTAEFAINKAKGLYFPRTDLTSWTFNTTSMDDVTFMTGFDGMIVYNSATGNTVVGQGQVTAVTPGFYYFYNPTIVIGNQPTITGGQWMSLNKAIKIWENNPGASRIELSYLSDGVTTRPAGTEMILQDDGNFGIGNTTAAAKLDVVATNQATPTNTDGILIPRIDAFPIIDPEIAQDAMMVYLTTTDGTDNPGFYYWDNTTTTWLGLGGTGGSGGAEKVDDLTDGKSDNDGTEDGSSVFLGINAGLGDDSTDNKNVGVGYGAMQAIDTGTENVVIGYEAGPTSSNSSQNVAIGFQSGITSLGDGNTTIGYQTGNSMSEASFNVAVGYQTLNSLSSGEFNTAIGSFALFANEGSDNIALGANSLESGTFLNRNVAIGKSAMQNSTAAVNNIAIGYNSGQNITTGSSNIVIGTETEVVSSTGDNQLNIGDLIFGNNLYGSGTSASSGSVGIGISTPNSRFEIDATNMTSPANTDGILIPRIDAFPSTNPGAAQNAMMVYLTTTDGTDDPDFYYWNNTFTTWLPIGGAGGGGGAEKIDDLLDGKSDNNGSSVFLGLNAGQTDNGTNNQNVGIGFNTLNNNINGDYDTAIGYEALYSNTYGYDNTALGHNSLYLNTDGAYNTALGSSSLYSNESGEENVSIGDYSLYSNETGDGNVAIGSSALSNAMGSENIAIGNYSGDNITTGRGNIAIGTATEVVSSSANNQLNIGDLIFGTNLYGSGTSISSGSIGIGVNTPNSRLEIVATDFNNPQPTDGLLIPRFDEMPSTDPGAAQHSMLVFLTQNDSGYTAGYHYWDDDNSIWMPLGGGAKKINDLIDGKSDDDGTDNYSSLFLGYNAGEDADMDNNKNVGVGRSALNEINGGSENVALGYGAGARLYGSNQNVAIGFEAGRQSDMHQNTSVGYQAGHTLLESGNVAIGYQAGYEILEGDLNIAMGYQALINGATSYENTALGAFTLQNGGGYNVAIGSRALENNSSSDNNVALGYRAMQLSTWGDQNIAIGYQAADNLTTGDHNLTLGYDIDIPLAAGNNQLTIANLIYGTGIDGVGTTISTGNIGIGVVAPSEKLEVAGKIKAVDVNFSGLPTYIDEAAAIAGGLLTQGDLYQTPTGEIRIKL